MLRKVFPDALPVAVRDRCSYTSAVQHTNSLAAGGQVRRPNVTVGVDLVVDELVRPFQVGVCLVVLPRERGLEIRFAAVVTQPGFVAGVVPRAI
jgi:hypothetical protein